MFWHKITYTSATYLPGFMPSKWVNNIGLSPGSLPPRPYLLSRADFIVPQTPQKRNVNKWPCTILNLCMATHYKTTSCQILTWWKIGIYIHRYLKLRESWIYRPEFGPLPQFDTNQHTHIFQILIYVETKQIRFESILHKNSSLVYFIGLVSIYKKFGFFSLLFTKFKS